MLYRGAPCTPHALHARAARARRARAARAPRAPEKSSRRCAPENPILSSLRLRDLAGRQRGGGGQSP